MRGVNVTWSDAYVPSVLEPSDSFTDQAAEVDEGLMESQFSFENQRVDGVGMSVANLLEQAASR